MNAGAAIVWFRQDLRLEDHPALSAAACEGRPVAPVYVWAPEREGDWPPGAASRWWLHHSLKALDEALRRRGARLILRVGDPLEQLEALARETGAEVVAWHRRFEPAAMKEEERVRAGLARLGVRVEALGGALLFAPEEVATKKGEPYKVFTPFWNACRARAEALGEPLAAPEALSGPAKWPRSAEVGALGLLPEMPGKDWAGGLGATWTPGEAGAWARLEDFLAGALEAYPEGRDRPDLAGTSRLSPHLHFGEISPRQVWRAVTQRMEMGPDERVARGGEAFLRQLAWREFAYHLLVHFPKTPQEPLRGEFARFPWQRDDELLHAWQRGRTGVPLVDAGMRQLRATGWMHNRVRMIAASLLAKNMLLPWSEGARWFWETLVDADLANNTLGWQWVAGCGADAAPFFRIFNPVAQGERFDPEGNYVRQWVPELAGVPAKWIHQPHRAPERVMAEAGVKLGETYPRPVVNLEATRREALIAYRRMKSEG
jgi:deoxyribodipyrimidine photo-lyase